MKRIFLLLIGLLPTILFAQNPEAVNDTLRFKFSETNKGFGSMTQMTPILRQINANDILDNDIKVGNYPNSIDTHMVFGPGIDSSSVIGTGGNIYTIFYKLDVGFTGWTSIQYITKTSGPSQGRDTGFIHIYVKPSYHNILDANNIHFRVDEQNACGGDLAGGNRAPRGTNLSTIYQANLWISGFNEGTVHASARTYETQSGGNPFPSHGGGSNTGPIGNNWGGYVPENPIWDRVWKVYQWEIDNHIANLNDPNYVIPESILNWPAHGDVTKGESTWLAPFFDANGDQVYEPQDGDYPLIKGDQAIYFIYNDGGSGLTTEPMGAEVHGMVYGYQCMDSALRNTVFIDYTIYNRTSNSYDSARLGMWVDFDLGNPLDDYVQCDVNRGTFFAYNGDAYDDDVQIKQGYRDNLAAQGVVILKGSKLEDDGADNVTGPGVNEALNGYGFGDGITDNEHSGMEGFVYYSSGTGPTGIGFLDQDVISYVLNSRWKDSSHMTYGGNGHFSTAGANPVEAKYMFPGTSDSLHYGTNGQVMPDWTEVTAGNLPSDRRAMGITGPALWEPGEKLEMTVAFVFGRTYDPQNVDAVDIMLERVDSVRSYYNQGLLAPCSDPVSTKNEIGLVATEYRLFPNPTNAILNVDLGETQSAVLNIYNVSGQLIYSTNATAGVKMIDIADYSSGLYLLEIKTLESSEMLKFIVE